VLHGTSAAIRDEMSEPALLTIDEQRLLMVIGGAPKGVVAEVLERLTKRFGSKGPVGLVGGPPSTTEEALVGQFVVRDTSDPTRGFLRSWTATRNGDGTLGSVRSSPLGAISLFSKQ
jgi:hypothetical protein